MLWIDLGIICICQTEAAFPDTGRGIRFEHHRRRYKALPMYDEYYHFRTADRLTGIWYLAWLPDPVCYEQSFFDIADKGCPYICTVPEWEDTVRMMLRFYLNASPDHRIAVLPRVQDRSDDVVHKEPYSLDGFMDGLKCGNIRFNELYFIKE